MKSKKNLLQMVIDDMEENIMLHHEEAERHKLREMSLSIALEIIKKESQKKKISENHDSDLR
jgi:hypothetical protein